jgi:hypothetical protein
VTSDSYVNWADGEPNNWEEQDCVQLLPPWGHKWDDDFCNYQKKAICEKKGWKEIFIELLCVLLISADFFQTQSKGAKLK